MHARTHTTCTRTHTPDIHLLYNIGSSQQRSGGGDEPGVCCQVMQDHPVGGAQHEHAVEEVHQARRELILQDLPLLPEHLVGEQPGNWNPDE